MLKGKYYYGAIFEKEDDGSYSIHFPDIPEAITCGDDFQDGVRMAKECLELALDDKAEVPISKIDEYKIEENETLVMIEADLDAFRKRYGSELVKKTLTIPKWLNETAKDRGINFSKVLREALELKLREE